MKSRFHQPVPELPVSDVVKSQTFYRDKLGFEIAWTDPTKSIGAVNKDEAVIFLRRQQQVFPNTIWIFVDNVDSTYEEFVAASITISEPIETKPLGIRQFAIKDPDGNKFIFHHDVP